MSIEKVVASILISITLSFTCQEVSGQRRQTTDGTVLKEIGEGIGGSESSFISRAKSAGFGGLTTKEQDGLTIVSLSGKLGAQRRCKLLTATNDENGRRILHAMIFLPERSQWAKLKEDYDWLKQSLTEAFGAPVEQSESVAAGTGDDDAALMAAVKADKVDYAARFGKGGLTVMLSITYTAEHGAHAGVMFIDKAVSDSILNAIESSK